MSSSRSPEQSVISFLMRPIHGSEEEMRAEVARLTGGDVKLVKRIRRRLNSPAYWPRGRIEGLISDVSQGYQCDRAMRILDAVIRNGPVSPPAPELLPLFDADRRADDVVEASYDLVGDGLSDDEVIQQLAGTGLSDATRERIIVRATSRMKYPMNDIQERAMTLLLRIGKTD